VNGREADAPREQQQVIMEVHVDARAVRAIHRHQKWGPAEAAVAAAVAVGPSEKLVHGPVRLMSECVLWVCKCVAGVVSPFIMLRIEAVSHACS